MILIPLDKNNINIAIQIQKELFPIENGSEDLKESVAGGCPSYQFLQTYWLAMKDGEYIGITGLYAYKSYPKDAWLGWFGVLENYRKKGFGKTILNETFNIAKAMGFETLRLYTDDEECKVAVKLYEKMGMIREEYNNAEDEHLEIGKTLIFSKSLSNKPTSLWNNKNIYLNIHEAKNKE